MVELNEILNLKFYKGEDLYSDGDVEDEILKICKSGQDIQALLRSTDRWPLLYHLSDVRENVLDWYGFDPEANLLEIGAGCGAISGLFCRKVKRVVAIDLSKRRSTINAVRNGGLGNLEILVGNFEDIEIEEKFDYVTLIGVLEYSGYYISKGADPYEAMLKKVKKFLKPGGRLIIAIENKFGLKYWGGAAEDHTGGFFDGIEDYRKVDGVRTFSRPEITQLLKRAGFSENTFYYPMPDYKLPDTVYSDEFLPKPGMLEHVTDVYDRERFVLFNESSAYDALIRDGQFPYFANSFLIISR
jgi:SAM-dependent methyltransferase